MGALTPSSIHLGREITRFLEPGTERDRRTFLEVGPGTGAFTGRLLERMGPCDTLDLVECDPHFCAFLRERHIGDQRLTVHEASIFEWQASRAYDGIVSSLPLACFTASAVRQVLETLRAAVKETGFVSYFEYLWVPYWRQRMLFGERRESLKETLAVKHHFVEQFLFSSAIVWRNVLPARVLHFRRYWTSPKSS